MTTMRLLRVWKRRQSQYGYNTLDGKGDSGRTPLLAAIRNGNIQVAHALINAGADVNAQSHDGYTALHIAAQNDKLWRLSAP